MWRPQVRTELVSYCLVCKFIDEPDIQIVRAARV